MRLKTKKGPDRQDLVPGVVVGNFNRICKFGIFDTEEQHNLIYKQIWLLYGH